MCAIHAIDPVEKVSEHDNCFRLWIKHFTKVLELDRDLLRSLPLGPQSMWHSQTRVGANACWFVSEIPGNSNGPFQAQVDIKSSAVPSASHVFEKISRRHANKLEMLWICYATDQDVDLPLSFL